MLRYDEILSSCLVLSHLYGKKAKHGLVFALSTGDEIPFLIFFTFLSPSSARVL